MKNNNIFLIFGVIGMIILSDLFFIVEQGKQVILIELGRLRATYVTPGLYMKVPFYQNIIKYDKRMLDFEVPATELTLSDQKRLVVDIFMRYKIVDPGVFYKTVRSEQKAQDRLSPIITGAMRNVLGGKGMSDILTGDRIKIMNEISEKAQHIVNSLGMKVIEVRISKTDLPAENSHAVYRRMISSLKKEAQKWRGKGKEEYLKRCAKADKDSQEILANADREAKEIIGQADADRMNIYNNAYGVNVSFAKWYLNYQAWHDGLVDKNGVLMLPEKVL